MSLVYITEYPAAGVWHGTGVPVAYGAPITTQKLNTPVTSSAFNTNTMLIRVHNDSTGGISFKVGATSSITAAVTDSRMAANTTEYFAVLAGQFIAVVANP